MWGYTPDWDAFPEWISTLAGDYFTGFINFFAQLLFKFFAALKSIQIGGVSFFEILVAFVIMEVIYHVLFIKV